MIPEKSHHDINKVRKALALLLEYEFGDEFPGMKKSDWRADARTMVDNVGPAALIMINTEVHRWLETGDWEGRELPYWGANKGGEFPEYPKF